MVILHTSNERITISLPYLFGHVPKFLSKLTFFFLKHGATLTVKVTGERRYYFDLPQGVMEIPAEFIYKSEKKELIDQMKKKTLEEIKKYDERRKQGMENSLEKKENKNKDQNFFVYFFSSNLARFK